MVKLIHHPAVSDLSVIQLGKGLKTGSGFELTIILSSEGF